MEQKDYRLAAIMYTDIHGFSRMMEQDEQSTLELLSHLNQLVSGLASKYKGRVIKTIGDALLLEFMTTLDAVNCGVEIQNSLADFNKSGVKEVLRLRIGIHLGDIYFFEDDALGEGINIAARLQSLANPGCICISQDVYNIIANKVKVDLRSLGRVNLKNITREVRAFEIVTSNYSFYSSKKEEKSKFETRPEDKKSGSYYNGVNELQNMVIHELKKIGQRIPVEKLKRALPVKIDEVDNILNKLAEKGFLTRLESDRGEVSYGVSEDTAVETRGKDRSGLDRNYGWDDNPAVKRPHHLEAWRGMWNGIDRKAMKEAAHAWKDAWRAEWKGNQTYGDYKKQKTEGYDKERSGFIAHLSSFVVVNGLLLFINITTGFSYPWFLFPLGGWGIGLASHFSAVSNAKKEKKDLETLPSELDDEDFALLRTYHRSRAGAKTAAVSLMTTSIYLAMINLVTSPGYPWAIFPIGGMMIGLLSSVSAYLTGKRSIRRRIKALIKRGAAGVMEKQAEKGVPIEHPIVRQAVRIGESILAQTGELSKDHTLIGEDMKPLLENYINQVRELTKKSREIDEVIAAIPMAELEKDLKRLKTRQQATDSQTLKAEYQRAIEQIEKQDRSFTELKNQKEIMDLRVTSSLNSLKQLHLDLARMKGLSSSEGVYSIEMIKQKTEELSLYLEDLGTGYKDLENT
ncbi:MAG: 2TM domain-containing protein [Spirochaetota bacterium]